MCINPHLIHSNLTVACRNCWQCNANRVNDLVGRCIAEQKVSSHTIAVTLTYRGDAPNCVTLVYSDFQKFVKTLRFHGFKVRYIVAGEYGTMNGRAHWHAVLFFTGDQPEYILETRFDWKFWPHGFSFFQRPAPEGFKYLLKYTLKGAAPGSVNSLAMSKKPPLGYDFFMARASQYVADGLSPQSASYSFPDIYETKRRSRKRRQFFLQGRMRELFLDRFLLEYAETGLPYPPSEFVENREDQVVRENFVISNERWIALLNDHKIEYRYASKPDTAILNGNNFEWFNETSTIILPTSIPVTLARLSDGSLLIFEKDAQPWRAETLDQIRVLLETYGVAPSLRLRILLHLTSPPAH
jgi:hypothetical protein